MVQQSIIFFHIQVDTATTLLWNSEFNCFVFCSSKEEQCGEYQGADKDGNVMQAKVPSLCLQHWSVPANGYPC